jgi:hypothetical protein
MAIRIKGKLRRTAEYRPLNIYFTDKMLEALKEKYDADSTQALFYALALDALGDVNLKKDQEINIEEFLEKYL